MISSLESDTTLDKAFKGTDNVVLQPFGHQVGGHSLLMKFDHTTICKPVILRELRFYKSLNEDLKQFTPKYHGVVKVRYQKTAGGDVAVVAEKKGGADGVGKSTNGMGSHDAVKVKALLKCSTGQNDNSNHHHHHHNGSVVNGEYINPWSKRCLQTQTQQLNGCSYLDSITQDYIVLDNLTSSMSCPCVLDLKMGTRQYGDDASDEKKATFDERCALSTSQSMGVRISGMQIYNNTEKQYTYRDKYYGRSLDREGFIKTLKEFVYDGSSYRTDIIPTILHNLYQLKDLISKQNGYRFYSSSLLLLYDGDRTSTKSLSAASSATSNTCVRMIDFAHTTCPLEGYQTDPIQYNGPDEGYVLGLNSLIEAFQSHLDQLQQHQ